MVRSAILVQDHAHFALGAALPPRADPWIAVSFNDVEPQFGMDSEPFVTFLSLTTKAKAVDLPGRRDKRARLPGFK
jgi:hypothetical protein